MKKNILAEEITSKILKGEYGKSGDEFPSIRTVAAEYKVSPVTCSAILDVLHERGLIVLKGKRNYLCYGEIEKGTALDKKRKKSGFIGVYVPDIQNLFFSLLAKSVQHYAGERGYNVIIMNESEKTHFYDALECFERLGVDAAIVESYSSEIRGNRKNKRRHTYPIILAATNVDNETFDCVTINNKVAGKTAADLLYKSGYDEFLFIGHSLVDRDNPRISGFIKELESHGVKINEKNIICSDKTAEIGFKLGEIVRASGDKTIGIFCYHDILANQVLNICKKCGYNVPDKIGIVGCDNLPLPEDKIKITTIAYSVQEMAKEAVDLALKRVNGDESAKKTQIIPFFVYRKNSVKNLNLTSDLK